MHINLLLFPLFLYYLMNAKPKHFWIQKFDWNISNFNLLSFIFLCSWAISSKTNNPQFNLSYKVDSHEQTHGNSWQTPIIWNSVGYSFPSFQEKNVFLSGLHFKTVDQCHWPQQRWGREIRVVRLFPSLLCSSHSSCSVEGKKRNSLTWKNEETHWKALQCIFLLFPCFSG